MSDFKLLTEQADQLRTRMSARVPIKGSLSFLDSHGAAARDGNRRGHGTVDGGAAQPHRGGDAVNGHLELRHRPRSVHAAGRSCRSCSNRRIPVDDFLTPGTIEWHLDRSTTSAAQIEAATRAKEQPNVPATEGRRDRRGHRSQPGRAGTGSRSSTTHSSTTSEDLASEAATAEAAGDQNDKAQALRAEAAKLSSPPITVEMTFNVYRTTKGKVGEPVYAEIQAINPRTGREFEGDVFPIKEYYTNRVQLPASILAGSGGALRIEIRCLSPTQYLGMAESDLYLLAAVGKFRLQLHEGALRRLAPGHGLDGHRRLRRHVPELAGGPLDDHRLLRRRPAGFRLPGRLLPTGDPGRRPVRVADPDPHPRQPDVGTDADGRRRARQDARLARHAGDVDAGLPRPQLPGARRQQHGGRRLHGELADHRSSIRCWPWLTPCRSRSLAISS